MAGRVDGGYCSWGCGGLGLGCGEAVSSHGGCVGDYVGM